MDFQEKVLKACEKYDTEWAASVRGESLLPVICQLLMLSIMTYVVQTFEQGSRYQEYFKVLPGHKKFGWQAFRLQEIRGI